MQVARLPWFEEFDWSQINDAWGVPAQAQLAGQGVPAQPHPVGVPGVVNWAGWDQFQTAYAFLLHVLLNEIDRPNRQSRG